MWRNSSDAFGLIAITLHWLIALCAVGLFALGLWMVELTYYDPWYRTAPWLHKSLGVVLCLLVLLRLTWRILDTRPVTEPSLGRFERVAARVAQALLDTLLLAVILCGYLISTADGQAVEVLGLFSLPATLTGLPNQADRAGELHLALAIALIALATVHALAALKHHWIDRDRTLSRMLGRRPPDRH